MQSFDVGSLNVSRPSAITVLRNLRLVDGSGRRSSDTGRIRKRQEVRQKRRLAGVPGGADGEKSSEPSGDAPALERSVGHDHLPFPRREAASKRPRHTTKLQLIVRMWRSAPPAPSP